MSKEFKIDNLVRVNIKRMKPYSSARHEFSGKADIFLDANENPFGSPIPPLPNPLLRGCPDEIGMGEVKRGLGGEAGVRLNRYPDPLQCYLKEKLKEIKNVPAENIFLGNGSDEAIDLLIRIFCEPGLDNIIICPPTYGMYEVCAHINNVKVKRISLKENFQLDVKAIQSSINSFTKIIFICSPNNPTGNCMDREDIKSLLRSFPGIVVIDEAYIDYAGQHSFITNLDNYSNLVVLQTLSKAWGLAGLRLGMVFGSQPVIDLLNKVKFPYNINSASQSLALEALNNIEWLNEYINVTIIEREKLKNKLSDLFFVLKIYPSEANFLLVKMKNAGKIYEYLFAEGIIVRDRTKVKLCENCLRITIGTAEENQRLIETLKLFKA